MIKKPAHAGSQFHNYKGTESVVLMAVADSYQRYVTKSNFQISASGVILVPLQLLHRLIH